MSVIYFYNTFSRKKEIFQPCVTDQVSMYVCGPTVYSFAHIGNARAAVVFDLFFRLFRHHFSKVIYVRNFTDIDDKINQAALKENLSIQALTSRYIQAFRDDMSFLNCLSPTFEPKVTEHIDTIIQKITTLVEKKHAYVVDQHVLFHVKSFSEYGKLSNRSIEQMQSGSRIEIGSYKKDPLDFVLWKPSDKKTVGWDSPWGFGRPGWHIECTALSNLFLGATFDVHGGGHDLTFPHHENEIAQGVCLGEGSYARYWLHNGSLQINQQKMSKSLGNILLVKDLVDTYHPEVIRLALISAHYRQPLNWNEALLEQSQNIMDKFYRVIKDHQDLSFEKQNDPDFLKILTDDLNIPLALAHLQTYLTQIYHSDCHLSNKRALLGKIKSAADFLGLLQSTPEQYFGFGVTLSSEKIEALIEKRNQARIQKDFATADQIRHQLLKKRVVLEDQNNKTSWYNKH